MCENYITLVLHFDSSIVSISQLNKENKNDNRRS